MSELIPWTSDRRVAEVYKWGRQVILGRKGEVGICIRRRIGVVLYDARFKPWRRNLKGFYMDVRQ